MAETDTIAAIATPPGYGGIGIVRVSGPRVGDIARAVLGVIPKPRYACHMSFLSAESDIIDRGIVLFFPAPHSYTGEDVLEFQGHGGPVVMNMLLRRLLKIGARPARPGEFTERAFLNGKLDLAQAEAVADLIESGSETAVRSAQRSLQGVFSHRVHAVLNQLIEIRTYVEAAIDFPEEEIDFLADEKIASQLVVLTQQLDELLGAAYQGRLLHDGMTVVLAGPPNAGKSSLLNMLSQQDTAIVSPVPGTTRDILHEHIEIEGMPVHVLDTAGLRESSDQVESEGVRRAQQAMARADRVLLVVDDSQIQNELNEPDVIPKSLLSSLPPKLPYTVVRNKIDLTGRQPILEETDTSAVVALSAKTGAGLELLRKHLARCMGYQPASEGSFMARTRHLEVLRRARDHVIAGRGQLQHARAGELLAEELHLAQRALNEITGEFTSDDLLGEIFSSFCIGK